MFGKRELNNRLDLAFHLITKLENRTADLEAAAPVIEAPEPQEPVLEITPFGMTYHSRKPASVFEWGDRVRYHRLGWVGRVIPRPAGYPLHGKRGKFVWVQLEKGRGIAAIRGCYAENLHHI